MRSILIIITMVAFLVLGSHNLYANNLQYECSSGKSLMASAVRSPEDARAFLACAIEYAKLKGFQEAKRAFHNDKQWYQDPIYVFMDRFTFQGSQAVSYIYPPDPSRVSRPWGEYPTQFGRGEYYDEVFSIGQAFVRGFTYYTWPNHQNNQQEYKSSFVEHLPSGTIKGLNDDVIVGVGIYPRGTRGTCSENRVAELARSLEEKATPETLQEFVRCAADLQQTQSLQAAQILNQWPYNSPGAQVYIINPQSESLIFNAMSDSRLYPWATDNNFKTLSDGQLSPRLQKAVQVAIDWGERFIYYTATNPLNGNKQRRIDFLKHIPTADRPEGLVIGAGYFMSSEDAVPQRSDCARPSKTQNPLGGFMGDLTKHLKNYACSIMDCGPASRKVTAASIETHDDLKAFVQQARCYVEDQGLEQAQKHFQNEDLWFDKKRNIYIYVEGDKPTASQAQVHVYPPDTSREGQTWGEAFVDTYGNSYYPEVNRILKEYGEGWTYYTSTSGGRTPDRRLKVGYIASFFHPQQGALTIGSGIYPTDLPGACRQAYAVTAQQLYALRPRDSSQPSAENLRALQAFVRCAAYAYEAALTDGQSLAEVESMFENTKYKHQSIYVFGHSAVGPSVEGTLAEQVFAAGQSHQEWGASPGPLRQVDGYTANDMLQVAEELGEAWLYYTTYNPATRRQQRKVSFVKRVANVHGQQDVFVGAGIYLP